MEERKVKGIILIIITGFFFSLMSVFIRLAGDLPTMQKVIFRNIVAAIVAWAIIIRKQEISYIKKDTLPFLLLRAGFGIIGLVGNFYAVDHLSIADSNMLNKLSPFFAILMSFIILKEKPTKVDIIALCIAFCGVLLVVKPGGNINIFPALVGIMGGFGSGTAYTFVRKLRKMNAPASVIVMFFSTVSVLFSIPFFILNYQPMTWKQLTCLLVAGVCATGGQFAMTAAYKFSAAKELSVFDYTQILFAAGWGLIFFNQIPDWMSICGYIVIISATVIRTFIKPKKERTSTE